MSQRLFLLTLLLLPTLLPAAERDANPQRIYLRVVLGTRGQVHFQGQQTAFDKLASLLEQHVDAPQRTVLELGVSTEDVTLRELTDAQKTLDALVQKYHLEALAYVGVVPADSRGAGLGDEFDPWGTIANGDLLAVTFQDLFAPGVDTVKRLRVDANGNVRPPILANPVKIAGLDTAAAEQAISRAYDDANVHESLVNDVVRLAPARAADAHLLAPIRAGDVLTIGLADLSGPGLETTKTTRVNRDGFVHLPLLQHPVRVGGMTDADAERAISLAYRNGNIVENAAVTVLKEEPGFSTQPIPGRTGRMNPPQIKVK